MKIFFHASILGKEQIGESYHLIVNILKKLNNEVFAEHILSRDYHVTDRFTREQHENDFQQLTKQIRQAEAVIVEATVPSIGTGHYMTIALNYSKPVLILYQGKPHGVLVGDPNRLICLRQYSLSNELELKQLLKKFIGVVEKKRLKNRFNIMLSDEDVSFLNKKSRQIKISKATYLRSLMAKEMVEN